MWIVTGPATTAPHERLEHLARPPIVEVVCGLRFPEIPGLDPVVAGVYWGQRKETFPHREIHFAIGQPRLTLGSGTPPLRTWLISGDRSLVVQLQSDRFYLNWRLLDGGSYPRFSSTDQGLLGRASREFFEFASFCAELLRTEPEPESVEVEKIDQLTEGVHWQDAPDLACMIPSLRDVISTAGPKLSDVSLGLRAEREGSTVQVALTTNAAIRGKEHRRSLRLDTTVVTPTGRSRGDIEAAFKVANNEANAFFAALIPKVERDRRFQHDGGYP
jgi:uncharacterized protein (TIGR04255 family)